MSSDLASYRPRLADRELLERMGSVTLEKLLSIVSDPFNSPNKRGPRYKLF